MANGNKDKRVNYLGKPYNFQDDGFSWDFKDSEMIDWYTDKKSGKIDWNQLEQVRRVRDGFMANDQWEDTPHITTSRKRGLADLDPGWYDYGKDPHIGKDGRPMEYPTINQKSYSSGQTIRKPSTESRLIDGFKQEDRGIY